MGTKKIITDNLDATTLTQFTNTPSSAPTEDYDIANKKYVDDQLSSKSFIKDTDSDTKIQTEETADEDKIRFDTAGVERAVLDNTGFTTPTINGSSSASNNLTLNSTTNATKGNIYFGANSIYDETNVRLGINQTSPTAKLHIKGSGSTSATTSLKVDDSANVELFSVRNDGQFFGKNFLYNGNSVGIGPYASASSTSGFNVGIGANSLGSVQTGAVYNVAVGEGCLTSLTTGTRNVALGRSSLPSITTANRNFGLGFASFFNMTAGENNIGIGESSGRYHTNASNSLLTSTDGIYIGYQAKPLGDSAINQIAIGNYSTGKGNNTISFGNTSTTNSYFDHNLNVGNPTNSARLHVKGSTSDNSAYGIKVDDSSNAKNFYVRNDGQVELKNYVLPISDGIAGQVLTTNGAGTVSFADSGSLLDYGEMYQNDNATATTINTINVWEEVNNFSSGELNGVTFANSDLTVTKAGKYHLNASISGIPQTANHTFEFAVSVNDNIITKTKNKRLFSSTSDSGSISLNGILNLSANDVVKLELRNLTTGTNGNFTVQNSNLTLNKI